MKVRLAILALICLCLSSCKSRTSKLKEGGQNPKYILAITKDKTVVDGNRFDVEYKKYVGFAYETSNLKATGTIDEYSVDLEIENKGSLKGEFQSVRHNDNFDVNIELECSKSGDAQAPELTCTSLE